MSAIARALEEDSRARLRRMTPAERLDEALALGQAAVAMYASAHGLDEGEARRRMDQAGQAGRRSSRVMRDLLA